MEAVQHPQNLEKVERGIEQALRNFADREANGSELREITAGERIDKIGNTIALDRQISFAQVIRPSRFLAEPEEAP